MKPYTFAIALAAVSGSVFATPINDHAANISSTENTALGINCRGSFFCGDPRGAGQVVSRLQGYINDIQNGRVYTNGEHIACVGRGSLASPNAGFCAFLQGTNRGVNGAAIRSLIGFIAGHNCKICGSVPIDFPGSNDPKDGILTVNYVTSTENPCPDGLC